MWTHPYLVALALSCLLLLWKVLSEWPAIRRLNIRNPVVRLWAAKQALSFSVSVILVFEVWIEIAAYLMPFVEHLDFSWFGRLCSFLVFIAVPVFLFPPALDACQKLSLRVLNALLKVA